MVEWMWQLRRWLFGLNRLQFCLAMGIMFFVIAITISVVEDAFRGRDFSFSHLIAVGVGWIFGAIFSGVVLGYAFWRGKD